MDFDTAFEKYKQGDRSKEVTHAILQEVYAFLENENFHSGVEVVEELTGIQYE